VRASIDAGASVRASAEKAHLEVLSRAVGRARILRAAEGPVGGNCQYGSRGAGVTV
jgi:hypothetical protein